MKHRSRNTVIAAVGALVIATTASAAAAPAPVVLNSSDHSFLSDVLSANQYEIDLSNYAAKKASSAKVRQFAQTIVHDDTQLAADLLKASDGSIPPPASTQQPDRNFEGKTGADIDKAYLDVMVDELDIAAGKFLVAGDGPQHDAAVRAVAKQAAPMVRRHDEMAKSLDDSLTPK